MILVGTLLVTLFLIVRFSPLRAFFRGLPRGHAIVAFTLLALLFAGHFNALDRHTFPFVRWAMYASREGPTYEAGWIEVKVTRPDGTTERLYPEQAVPALAHRRAQGLLHAVAGNWEAQSPEDQAKFHELLRFFADSEAKGWTSIVIDHVKRPLEESEPARDAKMETVPQP